MSFGGETCGNCRHWKPSEPRQEDKWPKWDFPGREFTVFELAGYLVKHSLDVNEKYGWPGRCMLQPTPINAASKHSCGQHSIYPAMTEDLADLRHRRGVWAETEDLRKQLREARELARKRYRQLQALKAKKPKRKPSGAQHDDAEAGNGLAP